GEQRQSEQRRHCLEQSREEALQLGGGQDRCQLLGVSAVTDDLEIAEAPSRREKIVVAAIELRRVVPGGEPPPAVLRAHGLDEDGETIVGGQQLGRARVEVLHLRALALVQQMLAQRALAETAEGLDGCRSVEERLQLSALHEPPGEPA